MTSPTARSLADERSQRGRSNRRRGADFEYAVVRHLIETGHVAIRVSGSHGPFDIVALRFGDTPKLIECKLGGWMSPLEREVLCDDAKRAGAIPMMACRPARGRIELRDVVAPV